jgi:DNA-binding MarR family transcriptional regulator
MRTPYGRSFVDPLKVTNNLRAQRIPVGSEYRGEVDETQWLNDDEQRLWRAWLRVHARLVARLDAELQTDHGLSSADYEVLVNLSEAPERSLRMAELAERLRLSPSGLTRRLDGLVRDGLVERRKCPSDGRGSLAVLTDAGFARLVGAAPTHVAGVRRYFVDPLSAAEQRELMGSLNAIEALLAPSQGPAWPSCPGEPVVSGPPAGRPDLDR